MQLVDKEDYVLLLGLELLDHLPHPLLEVPAEAGASDKSADVEGKHALVPQGLGDVLGDDPLREPLDDSGLAYPGSPMRAGLFLVRLDRILTRAISSARP